MFLEQLINGVTLGAIYALIAIGYTMVYGVLRMINFAHSEVFMIGAYIGLGVLTFFSAATTGWLPIVLTLFISAAGCGCLGIMLERTAYRPLRKSSKLTPLISAIGVSIFLQNSVFLWRDESIAFPNLLPDIRFTLGGVNISLLQVFIVGTTALLVIGMTLFIQKTRFGIAIRATSQDMEASELCGISTNTMIAVTFFIGGLLGGIAGVLNGMYYGAIKYNMGFMPGLKAFAAAVLGGIGNLPGAVLGGLILGLLETFGAAFLPEAEWKDVFSFAVLILALLIRPSGLMGGRKSEKV